MALCGQRLQTGLTAWCHAAASKSVVAIRPPSLSNFATLQERQLIWINGRRRVLHPIGDHMSKLGQRRVAQPLVAERQSHACPSWSRG